MRIFDAHTHVKRKNGTQYTDYYRLATASEPEDCAFLAKQAQSDAQLLFACGVHPWQSADRSVESLLPWFSDCAAIGEIGMDAVWCGIDLKIQRSVLREQLGLAEELKKPVILHTKGCEREVLEEISAVSQNILVHWYSCEDFLDGYLAKDCYFTVGPDLFRNPAVQALIDAVPTERLLLESDGEEGISWALGRQVCEAEIPAVLQGEMAYLAKRKHIDAEVLSHLLFQNTLYFLQLPSEHFPSV